MVLLGKRRHTLFSLGLLNYSLRSRACCIYKGYMSCLFLLLLLFTSFFLLLNLKKKKILYAFYLTPLLCILTFREAVSHVCFHSNVKYRISQ